MDGYLVQPLAALLEKVGLTPNGATLVGLALSFVSAYLLFVGEFLLGGLLFLLSGLFDLLDGVLARRRKAVSPFGAFLDSVADRVGEAAVLLGLLGYYTRQDDFELVILVYLALVFSFLVSYLRARAEGLGLSGSGGLATRPERVVILAVGLLVDQVPIALGVVAALSLFTVGQRFLAAWKETRGGGHNG